MAIEEEGPDRLSVFSSGFRMTDFTWYVARRRGGVSLNVDTNSAKMRKDPDLLAALTPSILLYLLESVKHFIKPFKGV